MGETIHIIYHADWDGIVAAWVARNALKKPGVTLEFHSINYGRKPPDIPEHCDVYILDFAFPPDVFVEFCKGRSGKTVQLDHHKTAIEKYGIETGSPVGYPLNDPCGTVLFEQDMAGCEMTLRYFRGCYDGEDLSISVALVDYAADHDLWKFKQIDSKKVRAAMRSYPQTLESCDEINNKMRKDFRGLVDEGEAIQRFMERQIESACRHAELMEICGVRCWGAQVPFDGLISEVAGRLAGKEGGKFGVCWFKLRGTQWTYSLRSRDDFDVSEIAKQFEGGGGHAKAAGFQSGSNPISFLVEK